MRARNERLVLSLVRRHGALAKAEIARVTGLSPQTVSVIMRALERDGLLRRGEPVRGKVGQPSIPMRLAEDGAFAFGLKIGRRSAELVMIDFLGAPRGAESVTYSHPEPDRTVRFAAEAFAKLMDRLLPAERGRVCGLGVAMPFQVWDWADALGNPQVGMAAWRERDIGAELQARLGLPVHVQNDASSACAAELLFGTRDRPADFLYFYVGYFIGGGVVLGNRLFTGRTGNAGALGSMPVTLADGGTGQLIDVASLRRLETALRRDGVDSERLWRSPDDWRVDDTMLDHWLQAASGGIAQAVAAASCVLDIDLAVIDGWLPARVRDDLVARTTAALARIDMAGVARPAVEAGGVGPSARSLGAASLPLSDRYLVDHSIPSIRPA